MQADEEWKVTQAESHWLQVVCEVGEDQTYWWSASVKWDGCVDLHRAHNVPFGVKGREDDHMAMSSDLHICDLDQLIERLQKLRALAVKHYGEDWPR